MTTKRLPKTLTLPARLATTAAPPGEDNALVQGLIKNDRDSLAAIFDLYGALSYGLALRVLGSQTEAEEVVQESFLALWRRVKPTDKDEGLRRTLISLTCFNAVSRCLRAQ